ncbi:aminodeoxychorismate synthase component I [Agromyces larvae]|uniref:aminodeoxychorismate synthase n=1 Tax=Agromyces larvae TaxID=2929802 RepID=A0ABY4C0E7_9MICO|nr:aminodeoxychorismate synthase component I [Agromyces larvae]UOE44895.1 aminodeoxychorismate synthase component I [Agromyces larvae]
MPHQVRVRRLGGWVDPEQAFLRVGRAAPRAIWLDGGCDAVTGRSVIAIGRADSPFVTADAGDGDALLAALRAGLDGAAAARADGRVTALGWLGWFGYEWGAARLGVPVATTSTPDAAFLFADRAIVFDHARREVELEWIDGAGAADWVGETSGLLSGATRTAGASGASEPSAPSGPSGATDAPAPRWRHAPDAYAARIQACRAAIVRGDAYQLCLTNRIEVDAHPDPLEAYLRLRRLSPAHHGGFVRFDDVALLSASPEQFLLVDRSGLVTTRPMKGTRPRGADEASDRALRAELLASDKERAENLMIVDLMRNDLGRIAELGTVSVPELHVVEEYPQVHQLVSTVTARLRAGATALDAVAAAFPAGSMTGAPKLSAMTILHELEQGPRGIYSGAFGTLAVDGSADLAMVIRSIVLAPDGASIGTGGGITALSDADEEVEETRVKARALLEALLGRRSATIE